MNKQNLDPRLGPDWIEDLNVVHNLSFVESFSQWLDERGDQLAAPDSFSEWLREREDSI